MTARKVLRIAFISAAALITLTTGLVAAPLSQQALDKLRSDGSLERFVQLMDEARTRGFNNPEMLKRDSRLAAGADDVDTMTVLVLLVDFDDNPETGGYVSGSQPADFDSILFSYEINPTGSMTEFYLENSYGKLLIRGEVHGWYRMPELYSYYVNGRRGVGTYPYNTQSLAQDAVYAADADGIDFSQFNTYGPDGSPDDEIDGLMLVFAGPGSEFTGDSTMIISHMSYLGAMHSVVLDGITINAYDVQPEEYAYSGNLSPIGVFCHEFGHILGLPDLYDVDYTPVTSEGVGQWSLMGTGVYKNMARVPSHLDAWSKVYLDYIVPIPVYSNMTDAEIPQVETEPVVYQLFANEAYAYEYFLVENRQKIGFDEGLKGDGLLIYHVDDTRSWHNGNGDNILHVAVEQADGLMQLEYTSNNEGDAGDPWPGSTDKRSFDDLSIPNSRANNGAITQASVWNISESDSLMTANLDAVWSRPYFKMINYAFADSNNPNGVLEPGETVEFVFNFINLWKTVNNVTITMTSNDPGITFIDGTVSKSIIYGDSTYGDNWTDPFVFKLPDTLTPTFDTFFVTFESDGVQFAGQFAIEQQVGEAQILIVDDDRGAAYDSIYVGDLYKKLIPSNILNKQIFGSPSADLLKKYDMVFWYTGDTSSDLLQPADISSMKDYLDYGGKLFLTGQGIAGELHAEDSAFLEDYLHARKGTGVYYFEHEGIDGSPIGDGYKIRYNSITNQVFGEGEDIEVMEGAYPAFKFSFVSANYSALSFSGDYKLVYFNFGYEAISNDFTKYANRDSILTRILDFFGRVTTDVSDVRTASVLPKSFELEQNYPNPFNPITSILYTIRNSGGGAAQITVLKIYNIIGQEIRTLVNEVQVPGVYRVEWDGTDKYGHNVASGMYFYRLTRGNDKETRKMVLLK